MWAPMCTISLLWSIGTDLTRCDFDLGSEQAWRNERFERRHGKAGMFIELADEGDVAVSSRQSVD